MLLRQLFDYESYTYTYLIGDEQANKAVLIDPVVEKTDDYIRLLGDLGLTLVGVLDTHTHADHISAMGLLREKTGCLTYLGRESASQCVSEKLKDGDKISVGRLTLSAIHTPGHTDDSYSFLLRGADQAYLFTGDTLLIRGSGRTDFQGGSAYAQYDSIFNKLLVYPGNTIIYPGHDYRGWAQSTVAEEAKSNPRLQVGGVEEYAAIMEALKLPAPKLMDVAVPINKRCGES